MSLWLLALAATAQPVITPYRAAGSEPAWTLTIADGRMTWEAPGRSPVSVATPPAQVNDGIVDYPTLELSVTIFADDPCADKASGLRFADTVFVTLGQENKKGCGGAVLPADSLNGTSWHFVEIAGEHVELTGDLLRDDRYAIDFSADGFVGYGGCNRFSAAYSRTGDILTTKPPFGATTHDCGEPLTGRERRLLKILTDPVRVSFPDVETMVLTGDSGTIRLHRTR